MSSKSGRIWVDANGSTRLQTVQTAVTDASIVTAAQALSNADWLQGWEGPYTVQIPAPAVAVYQSVFDAALLTFVTAFGNYVTYMLFAPKSLVFMADQETVDPTASAVLIAACIGALVDASGNAVTAYVSGVRVPSRGG